MWTSLKSETSPIREVVVCYKFVVVHCGIHTHYKRHWFVRHPKEKNNNSLSSTHHPPTRNIWKGTFKKARNLICGWKKRWGRVFFGHCDLGETAATSQEIQFLTDVEQSVNTALEAAATSKPNGIFAAFNIKQFEARAFQQTTRRGGKKLSFGLVGWNLTDYVFQWGQWSVSRSHKRIHKWARLSNCQFMF